MLTLKNSVVWEINNENKEEKLKLSKSELGKNQWR